MQKKLKNILKKYLPRQFFDFRHYFVAAKAAFKYHYPSREMYVIGVTGTSGKSTTVDFIRQILTSAGFRVGSLSTVDFHVGEAVEINDRKMTMVGGDFIQRKLRAMADGGIEIAIVETSSEGILQYRHSFIQYDLVLLTNLYPEHIEAHGGFANYKSAKLKLFAHTASLPRKSTQTGVLKKFAKAFGERIDKVAIVRAGEHAVDFLRYDFDFKKIFGERGEEGMDKKQAELVEFSDIILGEKGINFKIAETNCQTKIWGEHNVNNIVAAAAVAMVLRIPFEKIVADIGQLHGVPGRMENIGEAEAHGFRVLVDYAFEPIAVAALYRAVTVIPHRRIIHVCGSAGGGRDVARREPLGRLIGDNADIVIVTNEDPYDDDPAEIIDQVAQGVINSGKKLDQDLFKINDRREAISRAVKMADVGDLVLITGKGSEQGMCVANGKIISWDDRVVAREVIAQL